MLVLNDRLCGQPISFGLAGPGYCLSQVIQGEGNSMLTSQLLLQNPSPRIPEQERAWEVLETCAFHAEGLLCMERLAVTPNSS